MAGTRVRAINKKTRISEGVIVEENKYEGGRKEIRNTGKRWGKVKQPGSRQTLRPLFSSHKGRYDFEGLDDKQLQKLVKAARLKYEHGPREGEYITEAYPTDIEDPFFRHRDLNVTLVEGDHEFTDSPIDVLMESHLKTRRDIRTPRQKMKMAGVNQKYEIVDVDFDNRAKKEEMSSKKDALTLLFNSSVDKKLKVSYILGIKHDGKLDSDDLDVVLMGFIEENEENQRKFKEVSTLKNEDLNLRYYIEKARHETRKITRPLDQVFYYNGETKMGTSIEEVEFFLKDPENSKILDDLMNS